LNSRRGRDAVKIDCVHLQQVSRARLPEFMWPKLITLLRSMESVGPRLEGAPIEGAQEGPGEEVAKSLPLPLAASGVCVCVRIQIDRLRKHSTERQDECFV
jgi:hypothetical protein